MARATKTRSGLSLAGKPRATNERVGFTLLTVLVDAALAWLSMLMAVRWRNDVMNTPVMADIDHKAALVAALVTIITWFVMRQDRAIWRFTSLSDFRRLGSGVIIVMLIVPLVMFQAFDRGAFFPRMSPVIAGFVFFGLIMLSRLITMVIQNGDFRSLYRAASFNSEDAVFVGTATNLYNYLRDTSRKSGGVGFNPVGLIETSGQYGGRSIRSVPVLGNLADIPELYPVLNSRRDKPLHIISLDPNPDREQTQQLIKVAAELGAPLGRAHKDKSEPLSRFEAADLIGREPRLLDQRPVSDLISGRRVLITGAGGSIGSELAQQIAKLAPSHLALVDISELNLFNLERLLAPLRPASEPSAWRTYLADVCSAGRMAEIFAAERPEIVLHAAALKHVPLGQRNPVETLRTNVLGTSVTLDMCDLYGVEHFVLISTDKAVDPANVMGASKRVVELLTLARQSQMPTMQASAVRFGNVLASTGSAVNLFEDQIAAGGPVTVTHPDMERWFMTVEEASSLVLQAAALASKQESEDGQASSHVYVLEMGEPVNIAQLARNLIRLRGKVPDVDIEIRMTGLRAGEKLSERLTRDEEMLSPTTVDGVSRFDACVVEPERVLAQVDELLSAVARRDRPSIRAALSAILTGYVPRDTLDGLPVMHDLPDLSAIDALSGLDSQ